MTRIADKWVFKSRFRAHVFGWRSQPAITRIAEAVSEIKRVARTDPVLAADGAVAFLERLVPAIEQVDGSSGAIGSAVKRAISELAKLVIAASAPANVRDEWLERLWDAFNKDGYGYLDTLGDLWGELCATDERAHAWADRLSQFVRTEYAAPREGFHYVKGVDACLSALFKVKRFDDLRAILERTGKPFWPYHQWGFKALIAEGKRAEALRYAESHRGINDGYAIDRACETLLLESGLADEAYRRYALRTNQQSTYLATFRAVVKKYPHKDPRAILADLVKSTPGEHGKWFAAAKGAGLYDDAIALVQYAPADPKTLARAARDFVERRPLFAMEAAVAGLHWAAEGYGYEITGLDIRELYRSGLAAAANADRTDDYHARTRAIIETADKPFVDAIALAH
ncbi:MAG TPA: hypothetical protein VKT72_09790 [Candidatus Baltobacteraceae bacterium]|nr:hypothetical protein [Candidatus Baltobacteraceae bacterium]